ncbi:heat-inducible transcription repressor hrcA [Firmicutes bacterium CAG:884]|nr:heat-inducible transcription repressor hrcA [Firmicutes bacterium CAG:884]
MITERQVSLLKIIVEEYIKTARPVGSKAICEKLKCSSATIRNEMSALEDLGLLEKTHTSSGRIPSDNGYRYYVDNIMVPKELNGDDMLKLQAIFKNNSLMLNDVVLRSMEIISELTNYTAIVLGSSSKENLLSKMEVVPLANNKFLAIVITDKGHVEHRNMEMAENISLDEIRKTVELINKLIVGTPIDEICAKLEFEIKPIIGTYIKQHDAIYNAFYNALNDFKEEASVKVSGASNILMQPEFSNADKIREIVSKFEDKNLVSSIKEEESGVNIYIGSENTLDDDVAIIKTKYSVNGEEGTIALIGPKRMEYGRVTALLNYIKKNIER